jgi:hypothetical protein
MAFLYKILVALV